MLLGVLAVAFGSLSSFVTLDWWPFLTLIVEGAILFFVVREIVVASHKEQKRKQLLQDMDVFFLIPQRDYPLHHFEGAPEREIKTHKLTIGSGTYVLLLEIESNVDFQFDPINVLIEGSDVNKPKHIGKVNIFKVEELPDGSFRNWWGHIQVPATSYPHYYYHGNTLIDQNRIETTGEWKGKLHIEIPLRGELIIHKWLDLAVSSTDDEIPFLKSTGGQIILKYDSGIPILRVS